MAMDRKSTYRNTESVSGGKKSSGGEKSEFHVGGCYIDKRFEKK